MTHMADSTIRLLGPPAIESTGASPPQPRGRKAWAVLAYLALQPDGAGRSRLGTLLFPDAADPLGALRWNLSELRRTLTGVTLDGDPLRLALQPPWRCDAAELVGAGAIPRPDPHSLNGQLLEGLSFADCPVFDSWLADQRYRLGELCTVPAVRVLGVRAGFRRSAGGSGAGHAGAAAGPVPHRLQRRAGPGAGGNR
jgi:DNA-binding SARP family transcriptional activator